MNDATTLLISSAISLPPNNLHPLPSLHGSDVLRLDFSLQICTHLSLPSRSVRSTPLALLEMLVHHLDGCTIIIQPTNGGRTD